MEYLLTFVAVLVLQLAVVCTVAAVVGLLSALTAATGFGTRAWRARQSDSGKSDGESARGNRWLMGLGLAASLLTGLSVLLPFVAGERLAEPVLTDIEKDGGPAIDVDDASFNVLNGRLVLDNLRVTHDRAPYRWDIRAERVSGDIAMWSAVTSDIRLEELDVAGVDGWMAPAKEELREESKASGDQKLGERAFQVDDFEVRDVTLQWRPSPEAESTGTLVFERWRTTEVDEEWTLLDVIGHTDATGSVLGGALQAQSSRDRTRRRASWSVSELGLPEVGRYLGVPAYFLSGGTMSLGFDLEWSEDLSTPVIVRCDIELDVEKVGRGASDSTLEALGRKTLEQLGSTVGTIEFDFSFDIDGQTLRSARSLYEIDFWELVRSRLRKALLEEVSPF